ncbi:hypothetical protein OROMI_001366 [Orobanche minor]
MANRGNHHAPPTQDQLLAGLATLLQGATILPPNNPEQVQAQVIKRFNQFKPPAFLGCEGPATIEEWLLNLDSIFDYMVCTDAQKVSCVVFQLKEDARTWWIGMWRLKTQDEKDAFTWDQFKETVMEKYYLRILHHSTGHGRLTYNEAVARVEDISASLDVEKARVPAIAANNKCKWHDQGGGSKKNVKTRFSGAKAQFDKPTCATCGKAHKGTCMFRQNRCYFCHEEGHMASACLKKGKDPGKVCKVKAQEANLECIAWPRSRKRLNPKPFILEEAVEFFKHIGVPNFTFDSCRLWGWRCRAKLAVRGSSLKPLIGLYEVGTHNAVDIPECKSHHPNINAAVNLLKLEMAELNIKPDVEDKGTGELRYVQYGKVHVALVWNSRNENSPSFEKLNALANIIFGNKWRHLLGERDFWEHVGGIDVSMVPSSFGQANTRNQDCPVTKIGLSLAATRKCRYVKCMEVNKEAKHSFEMTASQMPADMESSIRWHQADTSKEPLSWLIGSDVVVDPPRKGLDPPLLTALESVASINIKDNISERCGCY